MSNNASTKLLEAIPEISFDLSEGNVVQFVSYDPAAQQFTLNEEALESILCFSGNIGFALTCGIPNCGKSTLMNLVMGVDNGVYFFLY